MHKKAQINNIKGSFLSLCVSDAYSRSFLCYFYVYIIGLYHRTGLPTRLQKAPFKDEENVRVLCLMKSRILLSYLVLYLSTVYAHAACQKVWSTSCLSKSMVLS